VYGSEKSSKVEQSRHSSTEGARKTRKDSDFAKVEGIPSRRAAGATRDRELEACFPQQLAEDISTLVALTPDPVRIVTHKSDPTVYFYIPQSTRSTNFELVIRDDRDRFIAAETFALDNLKCGLVGITIPQFLDDLALEPNQRYHWYFSMIPDPVDRAHDLVVEGQLQWTEAENALTQTLEQASALEQVAIYQRSNLWTDALEKLVQLKREQPNDPVIAAAWQATLQSVGLEALVEAPIISVN
jgi:hypothetical protein